jgi:hypothetical protein
MSYDIPLPTLTMLFPFTSPNCNAHTL